MNRISIQTIRPELEIHTTPAKMNIVSRKPALRIRNVRPVMRVRYKSPTFKVTNRQRINTQMGIRSVLQEQSAYTDKAWQETMTAIADIVHMYDRMKNPQNGETIPIIMRDRSMQKTKPADVNVGLTPEEKAKLEWTSGEMVIEWEKGEMIIEWEGPMGPQIEIEPHVVEVRIRNRPSVKVTVSKQHRKQDVGEKIDKHI
ncbi:MAG: DUF6470 family protein [Christensenellales bacterium]|jgi:hypothetical protein